MRLNLKISIFCGLCFVSLMTADPFATQLITVLLDDSEPSGDRGEDYNKELGAITELLYILLLQKTSIIIVNDHILKYLMTFLQNNDNPLKLNPIPTIDPKDFIKQKVTDHLYLIIPKEYVGSRPNHHKIEQSLLNQKNLNYSSQELTTGIQLKGQNIKNDDFLYPSSYQDVKSYPKRLITQKPITWQEKTETGYREYTAQRERAVPWISQHLIENLSKIFISKETYKKINIKDMPISVIIAFGHGSPSIPITREIFNLKKKYGDHASNEIERLQKLYDQGFTSLLGGNIAGFDNHDFGNFVYFIAKNIPTSLLFFHTCYGSEVNIQAALYALAKKEKIELKNLAIPYIIISGAITNATAQNIIARAQNSKGTWITKPLYNNFIEELNKGKDVTDAVFIRALKTIYPFSSDNENNSYNNIPIIKYPYEEHWRPLNVDNIFILTPTIIRDTLNNNIETLSLDTLFEKQKSNGTRIMLFATYYNPLTLHISGNDIKLLPVFISYLPGDIIHYSKKISAPNYKLSDVINSFFRVQGFDQKIFLIDELVATNDISPLGGSNQITLQKVFISVGSFNKIQFIYNNKNWLTITKNLPEDASFNDLIQSIQPVINEKLSDWSLFYNKVAHHNVHKKVQHTPHTKQEDNSIDIFANALFAIAP